MTSHDLLSRVICKGIFNFKFQFLPLKVNESDFNMVTKFRIQILQYYTFSIVCEDINSDSRIQFLD